MAKSANPAAAIQTVITYLQTKLATDLIAVYQFGSFGTPYQRASSDLDLAILCHKPLDPLKVWQLATDLGLLIARDVDLIDLRSATTVFRYQILSEGKLIYCANNTDCATFDTYVFSDYLDFNERRRTLLADIYERGRIGE